MNPVYDSFTSYLPFLQVLWKLHYASNNESDTLVSVAKIYAESQYVERLDSHYHYQTMVHLQTLDHDPGQKATE